MSAIDQDDDQSGDDQDDRLLSLLAERALYGLGRKELAELASLGIDPDSDPRAAELERALALVTLVGLSDIEEPMPSSLRRAVQERAFHHFESDRSAPIGLPITTTGANVVQINADKQSQRLPRRWLVGLALAAGVVLAIAGGYRARRGGDVAANPAVSTSPPRAVAVRPSGTAVDDIVLVTEPAGVQGPPSELRWHPGAHTGTLIVHGLPEADRGARREVWIRTEDGKKQVATFVSGDDSVELRSNDAEIAIEAFMITEHPATDRVLQQSEAVHSTPR